MPDLDEGSFLYMPTTMPHAGIGEALDVIEKQDAAIKAIPEVESVVGKIGRVETALDPAPLSMVETVINYLPEYKVDPLTGQHVLDPKTGKPIRNWRPNIHSPNDIWKEILKAARLPGSNFGSQAATDCSANRDAAERHESGDGRQDPRKEPGRG